MILALAGEKKNVLKKKAGRVIMCIGDAQLCLNYHFNNPIERDAPLFSNLVF